MMYAILLSAFAITMLVGCAAVIFFLREKKWTMVRDVVDECARYREKDARRLACARYRSRRSNNKRIAEAIADPISTLLGLQVQTETRTRR